MSCARSGPDLLDALGIATLTDAAQDVDADTARRLVAVCPSMAISIAEEA